MILERTKITQNTGKWWSIPWWQEEKYYINGAFTQEQVEIAFDELTKTFDAKWTLKQKIDNATLPFVHPLVSWLLSEGLQPFQFFSSLGLDLYRAREEGLVTENLVTRLKNPKEYWESALFELQLLSYLLSQGFRVEKDYKSGKGKRGTCNCDFRISKGDEIVFIEAKRPKKMHRYNEEVYRRNFGGFMTSVSEDNTRVRDSTGEPLSSEPELKKIFRHILYAVNNQLPSDGVGSVIIESPWPFRYWEKFEKMMNIRFQKKVKYGHLSFIAAVETFFSADTGLDHRIRILMNRSANIDVSSYTVITAIHSFSRNAMDGSIYTGKNIRESR